MNAKIIPIISMLLLLPGFAAAVCGDASGGAEPTTITDGTGRTFEYTEPTKHIVTMGYASTLTVAMLGEIDKIIAVDTYSTYEYTKDERLKDLKAMNMGSIYSASNNDKILTQFILWVEKGEMNLDDTIILTAYSNANVLRNELNSVGFSKVLVYLSITEYEDIVRFVEDVSIIVTGKISKIADDMRLVKSTIDERLAGVSEKAKGIGVWYTASSKEFSVGNTGSITVSLIEAAGGINAAKDPSKGSPVYGNISTIIGLVSSDTSTVIFLPNNYIKDHSESEFRNEYLGGNGGITIVSMKQNWNNYCPDAAEGLWAFACALYPDLFEGPVPQTDEPAGSNALLYAAAGVVAVIVVLALAYFIMKRP